MKAFKLDTGNSGCDEVLIGGSIDDVLRDVLHHHDIQELPCNWDIIVIYDGITKAHACEIGGSRWEAYDGKESVARGCWTLLGISDDFEEILECGSRCEHQLMIVDTSPTTEPDEEMNDEGT